MGRTSDARSKILIAAHSIIEVRGYSAMGVAEICKAAGVPKGSFYYFFESKENLALAVLDDHWSSQRDRWERLLGNTKKQPLQRLRQLFQETAAGLRAGQKSCGTVSGCLFGNLTLELNNQTALIRARLQEIFEAQVKMVENVITEGQSRGDIAVRDVHEAARSVVATRRLDTLWENCLALLGGGPDEHATETR